MATNTPSKLHTDSSLEETQPLINHQNNKADEEIAQAEPTFTLDLDQRSVSIYFSVHSRFSASTLSFFSFSTGRQSVDGATWSQAYNITTNSGFGPSGTPRSEGRKGVREGREKGFGLPRILGIGRTGKGPAPIPQSMLKALGIIGEEETTKEREAAREQAELAKWSSQYYRRIVEHNIFPDTWPASMTQLVLAEDIRRRVRAYQQSDGKVTVFTRDYVPQTKGFRNVTFGPYPQAVQNDLWKLHLSNCRRWACIEEILERERELIEKLQGQPEQTTDSSGRDVLQWPYFYRGLDNIYNSIVNKTTSWPAGLLNQLDLVSAKWTAREEDLREALSAQMIKLGNGGEEERLFIKASKLRIQQEVTWRAEKERALKKAVTKELGIDIFEKTLEELGGATAWNIDVDIDKLLQTCGSGDAAESG